jgi:hypothetical protein
MLEPLMVVQEQAQVVAQVVVLLRLVAQVELVYLAVEVGQEILLVTIIKAALVATEY